MINYWYKTIRDKKFKQLENFKAGSWVYAQAPTRDEQKYLVDQFGLDKGMIDDALDIDEVPRFESEDDIHYIFTRFPYTDQHKQIVTVPVLFVISPDLLITISRYPLPRFEQLMQTNSVHTTQRAKLVLQIIDIIVDEYEHHLTAISKQIIGVRNRLRVEQITNRDFIQFVTIEDELNDFMAALLPTNTILKRLLIGRHMKLFAEDDELIEDLMLSNEQSIETCRSNMKTIVSIRDAYSTIATNNLNQIIRVLTSFTVILTIPTIVASILGMNVSLPFDNQPNAFWLVIGCILLAIIILILVFRRQKWL